MEYGLDAHHSRNRVLNLYHITDCVSPLVSHGRIPPHGGEVGSIPTRGTTNFCHVSILMVNEESAVVESAASHFLRVWL